MAKKFAKGQEVVVKYKDGKAYYAKFDKVLPNGKYQVIFEEDNEKFAVSEKDISIVEKPAPKKSEPKKDKKVDKPKKSKKEDDEDDEDFDVDLELDDEEEIEEDVEEKVEDMFSNMSRNELKKHISDKKLAIKVTTSMSDDDIRNKIRELVNEAEEEEEDMEVEDFNEIEEDTEDEVDTDDTEDTEEEIEDTEDEADEDDEEGTGGLSDKKKETDNWYSVGDDADDSFRTKSYGTGRIWIPTGNSCTVTILNEKPFTLKEHQVKINGNWRNWFTCIKPTGERCPLCENGLKPSTVKVFYVIDHSEYTNKKGEKVKDQVRLLVMKFKSYDTLKETVLEYLGSEEDLNYKGLKILIKRSKDPQSASTGNLFFIKGKTKLDKSQVKGADDFRDEFKPLSRKELLGQINFIEADEDSE